MTHWRKENPEKARALSHRRRARKAGAKGNHTTEDIKLIIKLQKGCCLACGEKRKLTIDHIIPLSQGGQDSLENLQGLCKSCNSRKYLQNTDYRDKTLKRKIFKQYDLFET